MEHSRISDLEPFNNPVDAPLPPHATLNATTVAPQTPTRNTFTVSTVTPQRLSSHESEGQYGRIQDIKDAVRIELGDAWVMEDAKSLPFQQSLKAKIDDAYPDLETRAQTWLNGYAGYDSADGRWTDIPNKPSLEKHLYAPIEGLLGDIVHAFGNDSQSATGQMRGKKREVRTTFNKHFVHNVEDAAQEDATLKSCPDMCIFGTGPSATKEAEISKIATYSQVATPIEIKREETFAAIVKDQMSVYAREVFIKQRNRLFVYAPIMTGETIRVLQFDRSGAQVSQTINYHEDPIFFIKLVVLFSSLDEEVIGYDTSIYWKGDKRVMQMIPAELWEESDPSAPCWKPNVDNISLDFDILDKDGRLVKDPEPLFARRTIRSRGTVCWRVKYGDRELLVKDYWGVDARTPESDFLKEVAGIKGVGQMYAFSNARYSTYGLRGFEAGSRVLSDTEQLVPNRTFMRLALQMYSLTLNTATSALQLLGAVRDVVSGHRDALLVKGILHRDISFNNLLLSSNPDANGVLIDFDMAKRMQDIIANQGTEGDSRTGTRAFQSVKVLLRNDKLGHHDHMDDLESVFYVLFYVLYGHDLRGRILHDLPDDLKHWTDPFLDPIALGNLKKGFLRDRIVPHLTRFDGKESVIVKRLMNDLRNFFTRRLDDIMDALVDDDDDEFNDDPDTSDHSKQFKSYSADQANDDYSRFLDLISAAIDKLEKLPVAPSLPLPPPSPAGSQGSTSSKRLHSFEEDPSTPPQKKSRSAVPSVPIPFSDAESVSSRLRRRGAKKPVAAVHDEKSSTESEEGAEHDDDFIPGRTIGKGKKPLRK
ncbi:hypothetical protein B0H19DRAFT_1023206 [Mycena capillaripes]|nr:hypothetical protein B0H19DRAFT_1023206 [Mycena capillaripes]